MENEENIFTVSVNEEGKSGFLRIFRITRLLFVLSVIVEALFLFYALYRYFLLKDIPSSENAFLFWNVRIYVVYISIYVLLMLLQYYFFLKFAGKARKSILNSDSILFNQSVGWLYKSLKLAFLLYLLNFFIVVFYLFFEM
jgi:hypothetical protein